MAHSRVLAQNSKILAGRIALSGVSGIVGIVEPKGLQYTHHALFGNLIPESDTGDQAGNLAHGTAVVAIAVENDNFSCDKDDFYGVAPDAEYLYLIGGLTAPAISSNLDSLYNNGARVSNHSYHWTTPDQLSSYTSQTSYFDTVVVWCLRILKKELAVIAKIATIAMLFLASMSAGAQAGISGAVVSSNDKILPYGPFVGHFLLTVDDELRVNRFPSIQFGDLSIAIERPDGSITRVDQETVYGGGFGDYFDEWKILEPGDYVIPFFLLKIRDDFVFTEVGVHKVTFRFDFGGEEVLLRSRVTVVDCDDSGLDEYRGLFWRDASYVVPFVYSLRTTVFGESLGQYRRMADLAALCCINAGFIEVVVNGEIEELRTIPGIVKRRDGYELGYSLSRKLHENLYLWRYIYRKFQAVVREGDWSGSDEEKMSKGKIIIR